MFLFAICQCTDTVSRILENYVFIPDDLRTPSEMETTRVCNDWNAGEVKLISGSYNVYVCSRNGYNLSLTAKGKEIEINTRLNSFI